jgi:hypothetical protein
MHVGVLTLGPLNQITSQTSGLSPGERAQQWVRRLVRGVGFEPTKAYATG